MPELGEESTHDVELFIVEVTDTNYVRRGIGLVAAIVAVGVLVASLASAMIDVDRSRPVGLAVMLFALVIAAYNSYLTFLREWLYTRSRGSRDGYRRVSVLPMVGTLFITVGALLGFGSAVCAALGLLAVVLDTGGVPWFVLLTWRDTALWDEAP